MLATTRDSPPKLSATAAVKNNSIIDFQTAQNKILKNGRMQKRRRSLATNAELYRNELDEDFIEAKLAKLGAKIYNRVGANLDGMRKNYFNKKEPYLLERNMDSDPFRQFDRWFKSVLTEQTNRESGNFDELNAAALSTVKNNRPSSRMVLLKRYDQHGFTFFTHSGSRKVQESEENPYASMLFYWPKAVRQIRIEGVIKVLQPDIAEEYWKTRPIDSRIGSKISEQSTVIPSREYLEKKQEELKTLMLENGEHVVTRPDDWLGYLLVPDYFEFWQGQRDRVHDRIVYEKVDKLENNGNDKDLDNSENGNSTTHWVMKRLAP